MVWLWKKSSIFSNDNDTDYEVDDDMPDEEDAICSSFF